VLLQTNHVHKAPLVQIGVIEESVVCMALRLQFTVFTVSSNEST